MFGDGREADAEGAGAAGAALGDKVFSTCSADPDSFASPFRTAVSSVGVEDDPSPTGGFFTTDSSSEILSELREGGDDMSKEWIDVR